MSRRDDNKIFFFSHKDSRKYRHLQSKKYQRISSDDATPKDIHFEDNILLVPDNKQKITLLIAKPETILITTAVGEKNLYGCIPWISEGISQRLKASSKSPLFIIACENFTGNTTFLKGMVTNYLQKNSKQLSSKHLEKSPIFFCETSIDRTCCMEEEINNHSNSVIVNSEDYLEWVIKTTNIPDEHLQALKKCLPATTGVVKVLMEDNHKKFSAYTQRKLWLVNGVHYGIAANAYKMNIPSMSEALGEALISRTVNEVQNELTEAFLLFNSDLSNHSPFDKTSLREFNNTFLKRVRMNKYDKPERVLKDLAMPFDIEKENLKNEFTNTNHVVKLFMEHLSYEVSLYSKIEERLIHPTLILLRNDKRADWTIAMIFTIISALMSYSKKKGELLSSCIQKVHKPKKTLHPVQN